MSYLGKVKPTVALTSDDITDGAVVEAKIGGNAVTSAKINDGAIVNADLNTSAAIALSKLATDPSNASNLSSGTVPTARLGSGTVLQVINSVLTTAATTTSTSYVDTGLTATITPSSASNKVLVLCNVMASNVAGSTFVNILRDATTIISQTAGSTMDTNNAWATGGGANWTGKDRVMTNPSMVYLDSPSSTSATVYKAQFLVDSSTGYINRWALSNALGGVSTLCLMEIAA